MASCHFNLRIAIMAKAALWIAAYSTMLVLRMWIFLVWAFPAIFNGSY